MRREDGRKNLPKQSRKERIDSNQNRHMRGICIDQGEVLKKRCDEITERSREDTG